MALARRVPTAPTRHRVKTNIKCALVTCKVGELTGTARVRIVPPLPWKFDFAEGDVPLTWIGGRVRYVIREKDGERFIAKKNLLANAQESQQQARHPQPDDDGADRSVELHDSGRRLAG